MQPGPKLTVTSFTMLMALAAVWGGSFFFAEIALLEVPPLTITFFRVSWAAPVLFLIILYLRIPLATGAPIWGAYLVMGALNNAIPFSLIFWGQSQIDSGLAAILNGTTALFGAVVAGLFLSDEPLTKNRVTGAVFGLLGVAVIIGLDALRGVSLSNLGQLAVLLASLSYALASVWAKSRLGSQPPLMNALGMVTCSSLLMIPIVIAIDGVPSLDLSAMTIASLAGLALLSTVLAYALYFAILTRAGAANLMLVTLLIPPFAIALGWAFLGETLSAAAWAGFALIAIGLAITDGRFTARWLSATQVGR